MRPTAIVIVEVLRKILTASFTKLFPWADPGFEKGGGAGGSGARSHDFLANLGDFLKKLAQIGVDVRPLRPPLDPRLISVRTNLFSGNL